MYKEENNNILHMYMTIYNRISSEKSHMHAKLTLNQTTLYTKTSAG